MGILSWRPYLANAAGPVPLLLDLRIAHDSFGSISDLTLNGHLYYPNDTDRSLNETTTDTIRKYRSDYIRKYRSDYNNNPPNTTSFMSVIPSTSGRLYSEFVRLLFLQTHRETDLFFVSSGVQFVHSTSGLFNFLHSSFSDQFKTKVGSTLTKAVDLQGYQNMDGTPITTRTHTHPSHSQTSRLLTSSLSLGVPVPRATQCM